MEEILSLLKENNTLLKENNVMLKEIIEYINLLKDPNNIAQDDAKDFYMNIVANLVANELERDKQSNGSKI